MRDLIPFGRCQFLPSRFSSVACFRHSPSSSSSDCELYATRWQCRQANRPQRINSSPARRWWLGRGHPGVRTAIAYRDCECPKTLTFLNISQPIWAPDSGIALTLVQRREPAKTSKRHGAYPYACATCNPYCRVRATTRCATTLQRRPPFLNQEIAPWIVAHFFVEFSYVLPACS